MRCIAVSHTGVPAGRSRVRRIAVPAGRNHSARRIRSRRIAGVAAGFVDYIGWGPSLDTLSESESTLKVKSILFHYRYRNTEKYCSTKQS